TGHYAQILPVGTETANLGLFAAIDTHKDQTYFLHQLKLPQLNRILFPLGQLTKSEVRQLAIDWRLPVATKPDSVGICFVGEINVHQFLLEKLGTHPGNIVDTSGRVIGQHQGLWFYTIGQRHGFEIDSKAFFQNQFQNQPESGIVKHQLPPLFVIAKRPETNELVIGLHQDQLRQKFSLTQFSWIDQAPVVKSPATTSVVAAVAAGAAGAAGGGGGGNIFCAGAGVGGGIGPPPRHNNKFSSFFELIFKETP
ncbi:MAG TPA: hypothetical protein DEP87_03175, partial [Candidatus Pacebacteria bacterium]|nr:hypothetical protein [Candidatus Paceibacterota bacterium]